MEMHVDMEVSQALSLNFRIRLVSALEDSCMT